MAKTKNPLPYTNSKDLSEMHPEAHQPGAPLIVRDPLPLSTLHECVTILAGSDPDHAAQVNNVGFNKVDGEFGHAMTEKPFDQWTFKMCRAIYTMVRKYRGQLLTAGVDFDLILDPHTLTPDQVVEHDRKAAAAFHRARGWKPGGDLQVTSPLRTQEGRDRLLHPKPRPKLEPDADVIPAWMNEVWTRTYDPSTGKWADIHLVIPMCRVAGHIVSGPSLTVRGQKVEGDEMRAIIDSLTTAIRAQQPGVHGRLRFIRE
jgi:hypothetical protein